MAVRDLPQVQQEMLPKLKVEIDFVNSSEDLLSLLKGKLKEGPGAEHTLSAVTQAYNDKTGPFADFSLRQGTESDMLEASGRFASLFIARELHPYTQMEMVHAAPFLEPFVFGSLLTRKAQLAALPKIAVDDTPDDYLLRTMISSRCIDDTVREELIRRLEARETPFNDFQ